MGRILPAFQQFFDGDGDPLSGGKVRFTVSGTNDTDKDTFQDVTELTPNTNPVILDAEGRIADVFGTGDYRVTTYNSVDVLIDQKDPVSGGEALTSGIPAWNASSFYSVPEVVTASDSNYYRSLINDNSGNDPTSSPTSWEQVEFEQYYNANKTYAEFDRCIDSSGTAYKSLVAGNIGNTPATSPAEWKRNSDYPTGTIVLFGQATSPVGWTKILAWTDNAMLTINTEVDGTILASGGSVNPQSAHTHTYSDIPRHRHQQTLRSSNAGANHGNIYESGTAPSTAYTQYTGVTDAETDSYAAPLFQEIIACSLDAS